MRQLYKTLVKSCLQSSIQPMGAVVIMGVAGLR